jgi:hypothetical protein
VRFRGPHTSWAVDQQQARVCPQAVQGAGLNIRDHTFKVLCAALPGGATAHVAANEVPLASPLNCAARLLSQMAHGTQAK